MELIWKALLVIGSMVVALAGSFGLVKWQHDNPVEEMVERYIQDETGVYIDLSPTDPDPDHT